MDLSPTCRGEVGIVEFGLDWSGACLTLQVRTGVYCVNSLVTGIHLMLGPSDANARASCQIKQESPADARVTCDSSAYMKAHMVEI